VTVGAPIVVDGALCGVMTASWTAQDPPPFDAEERLAEFAELSTEQSRTPTAAINSWHPAPAC
jgi:hypothetical protein